MTKRKKMEKLLKEIPIMYEDYNNGIIMKYTPYGKATPSMEELSAAKARVHGKKLLCIIEQDMKIAGERVSLINYIIDMPGYSPHKHYYLSPEFYTTSERIAKIEDYTKTSYAFDAYCYNATWNQMDHGEIGILPYGDTIVRVW